MADEVGMAGLRSSGAGNAPRDRFRRSPVTGLSLKDRDVRILADLFQHRLMSREQIQAVHFDSVVRCNARLRQLYDHHFVSRYYPPSCPYGSQAIYSVGRAALPVLAANLEMPVSEVTRRYRGSQTPAFVEHTLAVVGIWLAVRQTPVGSATPIFHGWMGEAQCRHEWEIRSSPGSWKKEVFRPDGYFRLLLGRRAFHFFVECDLGHTSSQQFRAKAVTHRRYLESGLFKAAYGSESFRTLVVTVGERRLENLRELTSTCAPDLMLFTTFDRALLDSYYGRIWSVCGSAQLTTFIR